MRINDILVEFAPAGGSGDSGNYFKELASAWYNGTFDTGSLQKGIKSQQDVERLLNRGIVCPDGVTRKLHIDYNSDFDGVEIYSDDYYEYGDYDDTIDSRTGQKWGPYDFMAFSDDQLDEGLTEVDRRGFLKGLGAAAVAGAAGGVATKADAQEVTQWTKYATDLATRTIGRIHQDTGYDLRNWLVTNVGNWVSDYCRQTNSYNAKNVIDTCNQQAYEASGLDKENKLVSAFLTNMKNRYQDFLNAYRAGISEAYQKYNSALQSQQQQKSVMGNLGKEEFDVLIDALIVYAICKDRQLDNSDLFKAVAVSIKRFIDANNAKDYVNSIYPKAKQSVEVLKNNPELYQKESAQFFRNAGSTIEKLDRLSSNKKPEFESVSQGVAEGWKEESQDLEDWAKEVNKKLYKAHASQRPALAQQLSQLEHKHFGSPANPLTRIVKSALTALRNGQMPHYDSDKVGAMPFGSLVGDDAKEIAAANLHASENQGYSILKRNRIVDTVDDFLRLVDVVRTLPPEYLFKYKDAGGQAWFEIVKDIGWSKDDAPGQRYRVSQGVAEGDLNEKSTSQAQFRTMAAAAHDPAFAKKVGIKPSVAREFNRADTGQDYKSLPKKATEGAPVTTTPGSVDPGGAVDNFKQQMANNTERDMAEGNRKPEPPEADYGADYQDMVSRVKKLAGLGPLKTVYDPQKRVYKNMPTAVQPKKEQR